MEEKYGPLQTALVWLFLLGTGYATVFAIALAFWGLARLVEA